jgi:hypothetical protein
MNTVAEALPFEGGHGQIKLGRDIGPGSYRLTVITPGGEVSVKVSGRFLKNAARFVLEAERAGEVEQIRAVV